MKQLNLAIKRAQNKKAAFFSVLAIACIFIVSIAFMDGSGWSSIIAVCSLSACIIVTIIICILLCSDRACKQKLQALVSDAPNCENFFEIIEHEIRRQPEPLIYSPEYRLSLFITETWFILISANNSIIRRREDFVSVSHKLFETDNDYGIKIKFSDRNFLCRCRHIHEELITIIEIQMREMSQRI